MTCLKKPSTIFLTSGCRSGRASGAWALRRGVTWRNEARRFCFHVRRARSSVTLPALPDWPSVSGVGGPSPMASSCSSSSAASFDEASDLNDAPSACSFDSLQQDGGVGWGRASVAGISERMGAAQGGTCSGGWSSTLPCAHQPSEMRAAVTEAETAVATDSCGEQDFTSGAVLAKLCKERNAPVSRTRPGMFPNCTARQESANSAR